MPSDFQFQSGVGGGSSSASSGTGKNYLGTINGTNNNGDFELGNTVGWSLGNVTLTSAFPSGVPTFGSGASGNLSLSAVSSGKLAGSFSASYASSAATTAGNFLASPAFTLDLEDQAKVMTVKLYYSPTVGTTTANWSGTSSNSFGVAIYDVTNAAWIQPAGCFGMTQSSGVGYVTATFQTTSNSTSYRLVMYNANATSGAVTLLVDDFFLGPQTAPLGMPGKDSTAYTPTLSTGTKATGSTENSYWSIVGETMYVNYFYSQSAATGAANGSGSYTWSLPAGYSIDTTKISSNTGGDVIIGNGRVLVGTTATWYNVTVYPASTTSVALIGDTGATVGAAMGSSNMGFASNATLEIGFNFQVPIAGKSSNVQMSNDTDTRVVAMTINNSSPTATYVSGSFVAINFGAASSDTHGAWNGTDTYTVPVSGWYDVEWAYSNVAATVQTNNSTNIYVSGSNTFQLYGPVYSAGALYNYSCSHMLLLNAGQTIQIRANATYSSGTPSFASGQGNLSISRRSGPSVIAATESVCAKYSNTAGTSIANTSYNNVPFATKAYDSHNAWNGTQYVVPVSGRYRVSSTISFTSATYGVNNQIQIAVYKNTALDTLGFVEPIMAIVTLPFGGGIFTSVQCVAGDLLEIRAQNTRSAGATALDTTTGANHIEIERVGN